MKHSCCDSKMQILLHAYELGMISDEDKDLFETHLLECPFCFQQLKEFAPRGVMLSASPRIKQLLNQICQESEGQLSTRQKLWKMLWPKGVPAVIKPVVLLAILLLMVYPFYLGLSDLRPDEVAVVQEIPLMQTRSPETFVVGVGQSVVLSFICPDGGPENTYAVTLTDEKGAVIYKNDRYSSADSYGVGRLLLPADLISPGTYSLTVQTNGVDPDESSALEHVFHIRYSDTSK